MRKRMVLALVLVAILAVTSSCSLIIKDAEVDKGTVIVEVLDKTFTKGEITQQVDETLQYQAYMYSMYYGYNIDITDASVVSEAQDTVIKSLIQNTVVESKKAELGFDVFTDEELADMQASVDTTWQGYYDSVKTSSFADTELTGDELDKAIQDRMTELGYSSKETLLDNQKKTKSDEKLRADVVKDETISDTEVQTEYDARVAAAKTEYEGSLAAYGTAVQNGSTVYYVPAGYRYVKNILVKLEEADSTILSDINKQITDKQTQLTNVQKSLTDLGEAAENEDEIKAKNRVDLTATQDTLNSEIADLQTQLDAAKEKAYANIQAKIDEITAKLAEGADFDEVMTEYGEDTGMQSEPAKTNGYLVCEGSTQWVPEFTAASMALQNIGDVSDPFRTEYGVHIVKYVSDAVEGEVGFDTVKDAIHSDLLTKLQDSVYNDTVAQWVTAANAKIYKDRLAD